MNFDLRVGDEFTTQGGAIRRVLKDIDANTVLSSGGSYYHRQTGLYGYDMPVSPGCFHSGSLAVKEVTKRGTSHIDMIILL
jgi:hypothetical protein